MASDTAPCIFDKPAGHFDLTPLRRLQADFFAPTDAQNQFYYNLCGPVVEPRCPPGSGACMTFRNNASHWESIGTTASAQTDIQRSPDDPVTVLYRMTGTGICPGSSTPMSFEMAIACNQLRNGSTTPEVRPRYVKELNQCNYRFEAVSRHACPTAATSNGPDGSDGCTLGTNRYSLAPLRAASFNYQVDTPQDTFWLNFCGNGLVDSPADGSRGCPNGAAVCGLAKDEANPTKRSLGSRGKLSVENGILTWTLKDGEQCADGVPRTTVVRFPCTSSLTGDNGGLKVVEGHTACGKTVFEFPSRAGCDLSTLGPSGGAIFGWIVFSLLLVYFFGRLAYNFFVLRLPGFEAVPHIDAAIDAIEWARAKWRGTGRIQI
ncbi:Cation-independent mannose-6-phosphate receptor [Blastocladiella emersonii ATCC 22665]|nr:Cation-independent mannose-6-phosphate receptor [Blastocladiella emersonii ATCC 22665]